MTATNHYYCLQCHREVEEEWSFCGHCGADNRPPEARREEPAHRHSHPAGDYCVTCGHRRPFVDETGQVVNVRFLRLKNLLIAGIWLLVALFSGWNVITSFFLGYCEVTLRFGSYVAKGKEAIPWGFFHLALVGVAGYMIYQRVTEWKDV